jgi:predicted MFS family arabinose efflux permease
MPWLFPFRRIGAVLAQPAYGTYTAGNALSLVGTWMQRIAVGWLAWEFTGSAAWLGIVAFADLFPTVVVAPLAGAAADRWDRLRILRATVLVNLVQAAALAALAATGALGIWTLLAATLVSGIATGVGQPARLALVASLVRREDLPTAVAINSIVFNVARFIGPALAGLLIATGGAAPAFLGNALSYVAFFAALARLRLGAEAERASGRTGHGLGHDLVAGLRYATGHPGIGPLLALLVVTNVFGRPFVELLPGFAAQVFAAGPEGLAMMTSAIGFGAVLAGAWLAGREGTAGLVGVSLGATVLLALSIWAFVSTDRLAFALPVLAISGMAMVGAGVGTHTLLQLAVAPAMRGRVLALYGLIFRGGPALGALAMGPLADRLGLAQPVAAGALVVALVAVPLLTRRRSLTGHLLGGGAAAAPARIKG